MSELNESVNVTIDDATVITVPLVTNLTATNAAPTAKTVGDALADKVDTEHIMESVTIKVNEVSSDNQGQIILRGDDIPIAESSPGSILDALNILDAKNGSNILYNTGSEDTIKAKIDAAQTAADAAAAKTAADITYSGSTTVAGKISALETSISSISTDSVLYSAQTASNAQKDQAAANLGVVSALETPSQSALTTAQKGFARANIGAASATDVANLQTRMPQYKDISYESGVTVNGNGETELTITSSTAGITLSQVTILGVFLTWAWPRTSWEGGALVTINNWGMAGSNLIVHLGTNYTQSYNLRIRILYMTNT
jgi:hypothetical protein